MQQLQFSDSKHIAMILSGEKVQTTRHPKGLKKGETIELISSEGFDLFRMATVTDIIKLQGNLVLANLRDTTREAWAEKDGFSSFEEADKFMSQVYGKDWQTHEMEIIKFHGDWLPEDD